MRDIVVYGAGGLGREVLRIVEDVNETRTPAEKMQILGFIDDGVPDGTLLEGYPVLGGQARLQAWRTPLDVVFGIASPTIKRNLYSVLSANPSLAYPSVCHPLSYVARGSILSQGVVMAQFSMISLNVTLARFVFLNTGAEIGHDSIVGQYVSIMPTVNISGNVTIDDGVFIGVKATILQGLSVGEDATIGAASLVYSDVPAGCTVLGNPARIVKRREMPENPEK